MILKDVWNTKEIPAKFVIKNMTKLEMDVISKIAMTGLMINALSVKMDFIFKMVFAKSKTHQNSFAAD